LHYICSVKPLNNTGMNEKKKITVDLPKELELSILEMQFSEVKSGKKKPSVSEIVANALRMFFSNSKKQSEK
jgi:metal-responsive CopG/Arc/MetJ family transcriptional regulator